VCTQVNDIDLATPNFFVDHFNLDLQDINPHLYGAAHGWILV
jgi:hypothetical protein